MCYGEWMVIRNLGGSQSCCVLGRDCTEVRRYKKTSLLHDNELMRLLTEMGSSRIIGGGWLECRFM